ncbi:MAG: MFS transporter [Tannerella sp.]|jgi:FSR family fosmidomycin resistance protein-like MFS transporter|nr:MFS transporter [Tannerella sp.]
MKSKTAPREREAPPAARTASVKVLLALSLIHLMNDMFQSVVSASYPVIKENLSLTFGQVGLIAFIYQTCASVFQPAFGVLFDRRPGPPYLLPGSLSTLAGLLVLAFASSFYAVAAAVALIGLGSSVIHPEASRLTHCASGGRPGLAQSVFQVGGNFGGSAGPLLAAFIIAPYGMKYMLAFAAMAVPAILCQLPVVRWQAAQAGILKARTAAGETARTAGVAKGRVGRPLVLLLVLVFSKYVYIASLNSYYTFYLIEKFHVTTQHSQLFLFAFLFASAAGILVGGPAGDRFGRKYVIWVSILGAAPFSLLMPHAGLFWTCVLSILIGFILSSAFSAILVYAQELLPARVGLVSGLFFGLAFGIAGIAAAVLGQIADRQGLDAVYRFCAFMPLAGFAAAFLPDLKPRRAA